MDLFILVPIFGIIALIYTFVQSSWVNKQPAGNERMQEISGHIADGAMAVSYTHLDVYKRQASIMIDQILQRNIHHKDFSFMGSNIPEIAEFFSRFGSEKRNYLVIENTKKELLKKYFKK